MWKGLLLLVLLFTLGSTSCKEPKVEAPALSEPDAVKEPVSCWEFQHKTKIHGEPATCQMVWCHTGYTLHGGPATLWCEPDAILDPGQ